MPFSASLDELTKALNAKLHVFGLAGDAVVEAAATDSRESTPGSLFVARKGESGDGHDFLEAAAKNGAAAFLVDNSWLSENEAKLAELLPTKAAFVGVEDTTKAFGELAAWWRERLGVKTLAVTGSNGKTSTKEILFSVLSTLLGSGTANIKSYNNHVGLPQTILNADKKSNWLVLEAGMNHPAELDYLGSIAKPNAAAVLNVSGAHRGNFSSIAEIADAKCELLAHVQDSGAVVLKQNDKELAAAVQRLEAKLGRRLNQQTFGFSAETSLYSSDYKSLGLNGSEFLIHYKGQSAAASTRLLGQHNVANSLAAALLSLSAFPELRLEDVAAALSTARAPSMRLEQVELPGLCLINDAYNANPVSMRSALELTAMIASGEPFGFVLGDMLELGEYAEAEHRELGALAAELGASMLLALGEYAAVLVGAAKSSGLQESYVLEDTEQAAKKVLSESSPRIKYLLVKGSRDMKLERVIECIVDCRKEEE